MTLPSSGNSISMSQMRTEYTDLSDLASVKLSQFYYGADYLPKNDCTDATRATVNDGSPAGAARHPAYDNHFKDIPALSNPIGGSEIKLSQFYSKSYYYAPQDDVNVSGTNASLNPKTSEANAIKKNAVNSVFIDVNLTGDCAASAVSNSGLSVGAGDRTNTTVHINVPSNRRILGKGGKGGDANNQAGQGGGDAIRSEVHLFVNGSGRIYGGGGGGGASGCNFRSFQEAYCASPSSGSVGGCGGGGGKGGGGGGGGAGANCGGNFQSSGFSGQAGDSENTGGGGAGGSGTRYLDSTVDGVAIYINASPGGSGGGWGSGGETKGGAGGGAGRSVARKTGKFYKKIGGNFAGSEQAQF